MSRILIVDDSPSMREAVAMMLAAAGYEVCTSPDGRLAQRVLADEPFDLVLTDIFMPEEDGLKVIMEAHRRHPDLPIVAMSGYGGPMDMLAVARHLGACQLLRKPFSRADLLATVGTALGSTPCAAPVRRPKQPSSSNGREHLS
jgi:DNA-binding NtrC family response regulator